MQKTFSIRSANADDIAVIGSIAEKTELFPAVMTPEMMEPYLNSADSRDIWLVIESEDQVCGFTFCEPERMTEGTSNMLALAIDPSHQSQSLGAALTSHLEDMLRRRGDRMLLVETLGLPEFDRTRAFYSRQGFEREALIRDFYDKGQDKVIYRKLL